MVEPPHLPRSFLHEVEVALRDVQAALEVDRERLVALEELHAISLRLSLELGRPVTVFDVVRAASDVDDLSHRRLLVQVLRAG